MKTAICSLLALFVGVAIGFFGKSPVEVEKEKIVEKVVEKEFAGTPVTIKAVDNVEDLRFNKESPRNTVNANIAFDKEVPNGFGLLVVDLKSGGFIKVKLQDNHGPGFKWGGMVTKLPAQWTPKSNTEPGHLVGCNARFYSSDFPPEVLRNNIK